MAIKLKSVEFGLKGNPRSPVAPMSLDRGEHPRATGIWLPQFVRPEDSPLVIMHALLPDDGIAVSPVFERDGNEVDFRFSVECTGCVKVAQPTGFARPRVDDQTFAAALGVVPGVNLSFGQDGTATISTPVALDHTDICNAVECRDIVFTWKDEQTGRVIAETKHRLYVILGAPILPWSADPIDRDRWLWPEVLDIACAWAAGSKTRIEAATSITQSVSALGNLDENKGGLRYKAGGFTVASHFHCGKFLDHLSSQRPNSSVDCQDTASIVTTFANAVGCQLYQARCSAGPLQRGVNLIGQSGPPSTPQFGFHEMAWDGYTSLEDRVWDACLTVDAQNPTAEPFIAYSNRVFSPPADITGPEYTANRSVKPRNAAPLSSRTARTAYYYHPELEMIVNSHPLTARRVLGSIFDLGSILMDKLLRFVPVFKRERPMVYGEEASSARIEVGSGIAEVRLSEFPNAEAARQFFLYQTQFITEALIEWIPPESESWAPLMAVATASLNTMLVQYERMVLLARVSLQDVDLTTLVPDVLRAILRR